MNSNQKIGEAAEDYFRLLMEANGLQTWFDDTYYDFRVGKDETHNVKVEVKSCSPSIRTHIEKKTGSVFYSCGRFDFKKDNADQLHEDNCWICLILRWRGQHLLFGFVKAKDLNKRRHLSIHEAHKLMPYDLEEFVRMIQ